MLGVKAISMGCSYYLVVDVEATCCDRNTIPREETEIIEIGAVMVDAAVLRTVGEHATFVRPVQHPQLTPFCTELTSIVQTNVEEAPLFPEAISKLRTWMAQWPDAWFCSWGDYDRNQFLNECQQQSVPYPFGEHHLNLKRLFSEKNGLRKQFGMTAALRKAGLTIEGLHHRGIDDARNIARLLPFIQGPTRIPAGNR
jgi:inhibitor of KinA sporulation pathway (predicted exonuclease)